MGQLLHDKIKQGRHRREVTQLREANRWLMLQKSHTHERSHNFTLFLYHRMEALAEDVTRVLDHTDICKRCSAQSRVATPGKLHGSLGKIERDKNGKIQLNDDHPTVEFKPLDWPSGFGRDVVMKIQEGEKN